MNLNKITNTKKTLPNNLVEVFWVFLKLGLTSFGGPIAHIGYFRQELVVSRHWLSENQFSQLLAISQFLPGPASSQLGFSLGLIRAGWLGAIAAFIGFTLPSALILIIFASFLPWFSSSLGQAMIHGLKIVAFAVVADAVISMAKKFCTDKKRVIITVISLLVMLFVSSVWSQLIVLVLGAVLGYLCVSQQSSAESLFNQHILAKSKGIILLIMFLGLLIGLPYLSKQSNSLIGIAAIFYQAGALVFGGGHVVLPLLKEPLVLSGLISNGGFLAGYGAAQAIPGPMFSFAAYLGATIELNQPIWIVATTALLLIFLPGFLLIAGIMPFWNSIAKQANTQNAIAGINATVVGLLAAAFYNPVFVSAIQNWFDLIIGIIALVLLFVWRLSTFTVVCFCLLASVLQIS